MIITAEPASGSAEDFIPHAIAICRFIMGGDGDSDSQPPKGFDTVWRQSRTEGAHEGDEYLFGFKLNGVAVVVDSQSNPDQILHDWRAVVNGLSDRLVGPRSREEELTALEVERDGLLAKLREQEGAKEGLTKSLELALKILLGDGYPGRPWQT